MVGSTEAGPKNGNDMKFTRFTKYTGEPADSVDLEELVKRLGDFFLQSGFESQYYGISEFDPDRSMEALREAILRALQEGDLLSDDKLTEELRKLLNRSDASNNQQIKDLLDKLVERLSNRLRHPTRHRLEALSAIRKSARRKRDLKLLIRPSTFWGSKLCVICLALWEGAVLAGMTRATWRPEWRRAAHRGPTNSVTP